MTKNPMSILVVLILILVGGSWLQHRGKVKREEAAKRERFVQDSVRVERARQDSIRQAAELARTQDYSASREQYQARRAWVADSLRDARCRPQAAYGTAQSGSRARTIEEADQRRGC